MFFNSSLMIGGTLTNVSTDFTLQAGTLIIEKLKVVGRIGRYFS
jgi:hypothetical protein